MNKKLINMFRYKVINGVDYMGLKAVILLMIVVIIESLIIGILIGKHYYKKDVPVQIKEEFRM